MNIVFGIVVVFSFLVLAFALGVSGLGFVVVWFGVVCGCLFLLG